MSSSTETMKAVLLPLHDYLLPQSLDYLPRALANELLDAFQRFIFAMELAGEDVSQAEPLLEELFLWLGDDVTRPARRFLPSDVVFPAAIIESDQTFVPLAVRRLLRDPANLAEIIRRVRRIEDAHLACLKFYPAEMARVSAVRSAIQQYIRGKQKRKVNDDEVIRQLQAQGWGNPGALKKAIVADVAEKLKISQPSVRLVAQKNGLTGSGRSH